MTALPDRAKASPDVEDVVQRLIVASGIGKSSADNENYVANASIKDCDDAIATIRTLTARAEAAEAECARLTSELAGITDRIMERITNAHDQGYREATNAAEARAETARAEALEEAAKLAETPSGINRGRENARGKAIAKSIRALLTAPPPTAGQREKTK